MGIKKNPKRAQNPNKNGRRYTDEQLDQMVICVDGLQEIHPGKANEVKTVVQFTGKGAAPKGTISTDEFIMNSEISKHLRDTADIYFETPFTVFPWYQRLWWRIKIFFVGESK